MDLVLTSHKKITPKVGYCFSWWHGSESTRKKDADIRA